MAIAFLWTLQNLWPFRFDELKASKRIVNKLNIPEHTKQFVFAVHNPETQSIIYILSAVNLSERSASDAQSLIREIKPDAVVVQAGLSPFSQIQEDEGEGNDAVLENNPVPTSSFGVIKRCFVDKIGRDKYESVAGNFVLREIFGTSFHGPLLAAKKAADDVGSSFIVIDSPLGKSCWGGSNNDNDNNNNDDDDDDNGGGENSGRSHFQSLVSSLIPQQQGAAMKVKRFCLNDEVRMQMVKALSGYNGSLFLGNGNKAGSVSEGGSVGIQPKASYDYETPGFAKSIYPLLEDLHYIFSDIPSMGQALAHVQKMLLDVNRGEVLDNRTVSEVYTFRVAVEGLRVALNNRGLQPISGPKWRKIEFSELPFDDKSQVLFAQAIRSQTDKFKTVVAVVDASALAGLRKHWDTPLPGEVKELVGQLITNSEDEGDVVNQSDRKGLLAGKPVVAVGAGATAVLGASSLTKGVPASTLLKVVTFKTPASLKIVLSQMQRAMAFAFGPSKVVAPGFATSGIKTSGVLKTAVSTEKIRAVTHSVIASAEKTSISAMRTTFYEIMRKRKVRPIGFLPWATFAGSVGTCTGLLLCGDGIECAIESLPAAPSIASLGRGIQHLREASQAVMKTEGTRIQGSIESLVNRIKKARDQ
ncbi:uncharacterized protein LOC130745083 [Lotus japonicus]|uniref:uncharacterized protein LOC130745083 n=1 Tax=Lotus japonicus TaxID=34305 RepID=UPI00258D1B2A|nr:uncharacterized protein LOC130745083 [Lotus japonicus]